MEEIKINEISYSPGYGDMLGGYHRVILSKDEDGNWTYVSSDREDRNVPAVTAVYSADSEAVAKLEAFISEKEILSLEERPEDNLFISDYSPWSWSIDYEMTTSGKTEHGYCTIGQYKKYSEQDRELLEELSKMFTALRGEKISETVE